MLAATLLRWQRKLSGGSRRSSRLMWLAILGSCKLTRAGTHARLKARFHDLVAPRIEACGGRIVKLMGDGLLAEFPSVVTAAEWATEIQAAVGEANRSDSSDRRIEYRVGVNMGDIIVDGDDIYGEGVNVAARLQEIAEPGGVCLSDTAFQQVRGKIDAQFSDGGEVSLKNITGPVRIWRWSQHEVIPIDIADLTEPVPRLQSETGDRRSRLRKPQSRFGAGCPGRRDRGGYSHPARNVAMVAGHRPQLQLHL